MSKPKARRVPSDDCVVTVGTEESHPHEGEWVEVIPGFPVGALKAQRGLSELSVKLAAVNDNESAKRLAIVDDTYQQVIAALAERIVNWNWTSDLGTPLPNPKEKPEVLQQLRVEEMYYLAAVVRGAGPGDQKNG